MSLAGSPGPFRPTDVLLLATVSLVWGAAYVLIRQGLIDGATPLAYAAARYGLSALVFVAIAAVRGSPRPHRRELLVSATVGGTLLLAFYGGLLYWGEQFTSGGYAAVLASTVPLLTAGFGFLLLSTERLGSLGLLGMAVGFVGSTLLVVPDLTGSLPGVWPGPLFVLGAMVSAALGTVLLRRWARGPQGLWQIGSQFATAALLLGAVSLVLPTPESLGTGPGVLLPLLLLVGLSSVVGYFAYFRLHHRVGPVRANIVAYLAPLVGLGLGAILLAEPITAWEVAGVAVVFVGVTVVLWDARRAVRRADGHAERAPGSPPER